MNIKKTICALVLGVSLSLSAISAGATAKQIIINGEVKDIPEGMGTIREMDDRTFAPVRFVAESLGCTVNYNNVQASATITDKKNVSYVMMENSNMLFKLPDAENPIMFIMDTNVFISDEDRMYIPIRFLAEALGYTVEWDEVTETVSITQDDAVEPTLEAVEAKK